MEESEIAFENDIYREIAEEKGWDYKEVEELISMHLQYFREVRVKDPNITAFKLGKNLGSLMCNMYLVNRDKIKFEGWVNGKSEYKQDWKKSSLDVINKRKEKMEAHCRLAEEQGKVSKYLKKPFIWLLKKPIEKIRGSYIPLGVVENRAELFRVLGEFQNKIANEDE
ncbi:MAG: hypothetical protein CMH22_06280 [Methylophaga sp.]|nr:hypothetical protein [Methylophaga sp.]|tara:strand:- start:33990 stop:34493 length:504 start_codon:yes stop_codon:yes gene_type:complete